MYQEITMDSSEIEVTKEMIRAAHSELAQFDYSGVKVSDICDDTIASLYRAMFLANHA
jgi:hypothetical protein